VTLVHASSLECVVVAASCVLNDFCALVRRFCVVFPPGQIEFREQYLVFVTKHHVILTGSKFVAFKTFEELLIGKVKHTRMRILKGIKRLERGIPRDGGKFSLFTKREKLSKSVLLVESKQHLDGDRIGVQNGQPMDAWDFVDSTIPFGIVNPRAICYDEEDTYVALKQFIEPFQEYLEQFWGDSNGFFFLGGRNITDMDNWFNYQVKRGRLFAFNDMSNYDRSCHEHFHMALVATYRYHGMPEYLANLRLTQIRGKVRSRFGFRLESVPQLKSGVADTCVGNSMTNGFTFLFALSLCNRQFTVEQVLSKVAIALLGDDNLISYDSDLSMAGVYDILCHLGLVPKLVVIAPIHEIVLLNLRPYQVGPNYHFAPKIGRILMRLSCAVDLPMGVPAEVYFTAVCKGLSANVHHVPLLRAYIAGFLENHSWDRHFETSPWFQWKAERTYLSDSQYVATEETFLFVNLAYHCTFSVQDYILTEKFLFTLPKGPALYNHPVVRYFILFDR